MRLLILGAGVMSGAIVVPATDNGHRVWLAGTPFDEARIASIRESGLRGVSSSAGVVPCMAESLSSELLSRMDVVVLGVSTPGLSWALEFLQGVSGKPLLFLTKGLVSSRGLGVATQDMWSYLHSRWSSSVVGVSGPCLAGELARRCPTSVVFSGPEEVLERMCAVFQTPYYRIHPTTDGVGASLCAALKNLLAVGVAAARSYFAPRSTPPARRLSPTATRLWNPPSGLFSQALQELAGLCRWLGGDSRSAYGLSGAGDLFVTSLGGRNSRLGLALGEGMTVQEALSGPLADETVEGVHVGRCLAPAFSHAVAHKTINAEHFPLTAALLDCLSGNDRSLRMDFARICVSDISISDAAGGSSDYSSGRSSDVRRPARKL